MAAYNDTLICMRLWLCDSVRLFVGFLAVLPRCASCAASSASIACSALISCDIIDPNVMCGLLCLSHCFVDLLSLLIGFCCHFQGCHCCQGRLPCSSSSPAASTAPSSIPSPSSFLSSHPTPPSPHSDSNSQLKH